MRWGGVFASVSPHRRKVVLNRETKNGFSFEKGKKEEGEVAAATPTRSSNWARMLSRFFGIDALKCDCGGELRPVSAILKGDEVNRYLRHLGLDADPPNLEVEEASVQTSLFSGVPYK